MPLVLITGASRGLGRALALGFNAAGWTVSACATDRDATNLSPTNSAWSILPDLRCDQPAEIGVFATVG